MFYLEVVLISSFIRIVGVIKLILFSKMGVVPKNFARLRAHNFKNPSSEISGSAFDMWNLSILQYMYMYVCMTQKPHIHIPKDFEGSGTATLPSCLAGTQSTLRVVMLHVHYALWHNVYMWHRSTLQYMYMHVIVKLHVVHPCIHIPQDLLF